MMNGGTRKYKKTWDAIEAAFEQSKGLTEYNLIERYVASMRRFPADRDYLEWTLVCCAGSELLDHKDAPLWNGVLKIFNEERKEVDRAARQSRGII